MGASEGTPPEGKRSKREIDYTRMAPLLLAPLFPASALVVRNYPKAQMPVACLLGGTILASAHFGLFAVSVGNK